LITKWVVFFVWGTISVGASMVQGYKDQFYQVNSSANQACVYDFNYTKNWCVPVQPNAMGMYLSFKQWLIYSKTALQAIDLIRREVKWEMPLEKISKLHINYPVIITLSLDGTLAGYDFFTGIFLWKKKTAYTNMFETQSDVWVVSKGKIQKIDVVSSDVIDEVSIPEPITYLYGDAMYLFLSHRNQLIHYNTINQHRDVVGESFRFIDRVSNMVLVGSTSQRQLRTFKNQIVSENIQEDLFKVHSLTQSFFVYKKNEMLYMVTLDEDVPYEFTHLKIKDTIEYGYRMGDKIRVFRNNEHDLWTLKRIKKKESVQDT
jgi:hypothetical protein